MNGACTYRKERLAAAVVTSRRRYFITEKPAAGLSMIRRTETVAMWFLQIEKQKFSILAQAGQKKAAFFIPSSEFVARRCL